jgi:hypothetical protein
MGQEMKADGSQTTEQSPSSVVETTMGDPSKSKNKFNGLVPDVMTT